MAETNQNQGGAGGAGQQTQGEGGQTAADKANTQTGGDKGKKAPALGTDQRPTGAPTPVAPKDERNTRPENTESGRLGDGGPKANAKGENQGNMSGEEERPPQENATAGGPDAGQTAANEPGMSHQ